MNELRNIDVHIISIVDKGANRKNIIWKALDANNDNFQHSFNIKKTNDEKRIVYGIVYSPNEVDAHGDFATSEEIEKACYGFMKKSKTNSIDTQHDMNVCQDCFVGENWIVKDHDALFPDDLGAWAIGIRVENDEVWKSVKSGEFGGISMYGHAEKVEKSEDVIEKGILKYFRKVFNGETETTDSEEIVKDFNSRVAMMDFPKLLDALYSSTYDILHDESVTDKKSAILESVDQFKSYLAEVETAKSFTVVKAGRMISDANVKKLQAAMQSIQAILDAADKAQEKRESAKEDKIKKNNSEGDTEMTDAEIQKKIDDALKPALDNNETLKKENDELKVRLEAVEKASKGSSQEHSEIDRFTKEPVKKGYRWLDNISP